jgi:hypothetical protein
LCGRKLLDEEEVDISKVEDDRAFIRKQEQKTRLAGVFGTFGDREGANICLSLLYIYYFIHLAFSVYTYSDKLVS